MIRKSLRDESQSVFLFIIVAVTYALVYLTKNCYSAAMASIVNEGIMTKSQTGLISALFYLLYAPFQIVGGIAADKFSPNKLILIGVIGAGIANLLIYLVEGYVAMLIIWSLNGIVQFGVWPGIFKIVTTQLHPEHRAKCVFYITISSSAGLLMSYISAALITNWKYNFLLSAVIMFVNAIVFFICYNKTEKHMEEDIPLKEEKEEIKKPEEKINIISLMLKAGVPILLIVNMIMNMLNLGIKSLAPVMLMESYSSLTPSLANALNIILVLAAPIGMFLAKNRFFTKFSHVTAISIFFAVCVPLLLVITFIGKVNLFVILSALAVLMVALTSISMFYSQISMYFAKFGRSATLSGIFNCMASLGIVLSNYVFAKVADLFGWTVTTQCWFFAALGSLILTLICVPVWKKFTNKY